MHACADGIRVEQGRNYGSYRRCFNDNVHPDTLEDEAVKTADAIYGEGCPATEVVRGFNPLFRDLAYRTWRRRFPVAEFRSGVAAT